VPLQEGLQYLLELQQLDSQIVSRQEALLALPGKRKQFEEALAAVAAALESSGEALQAGELQQRQGESDLQDREALLQKLEGQQFQVKDNAAYTALLHEMDHAKTAISDCETRILEGMEAVETAREALSRAEVDDRATRERVASGGRDLDAREEKYQGELVELNAQRDQLSTKLDAELLAVYEKIAKRRRPVLALVSEEMCEGCRVGIPAQNYIEILKGERIITCGNCQRILLHPEMVSSVAAAGGSALEKL